MPAAPSFCLAMLRMPRVRNCLQEILISPLAADIFRRPRAGAGDTSSEFRGDGERQLRFDVDDMVPAVPEIVPIFEGNPRCAREVAHPNFALVEQSWFQIGRHIVSDFEVAVTQSADLKFVEVAIPPIESGLDTQMQLMQVPGDWNNESSPYRRRDAGNFDPNLCGVQFFERHG